MLTTDLQDHSNVISIHNKAIEKQQKEEIEEMTYDSEMNIFMKHIYPCMSKKEQYTVFYGNPSTDELEEIMKRVVKRANINTEFMLEKLN